LLGGLALFRLLPLSAGFVLINKLQIKVEISKKKLSKKLPKNLVISLKINIFEV